MQQNRNAGFSERDKLISLPQFTYDVCCIDPRANNLHSNFIFSLYDNILKKKYQAFTTLQSTTVQIHAVTYRQAFWQVSHSQNEQSAVQYPVRGFALL